MLRNRTLKTKMSLGFALAILTMFSAALFGLLGLVKNNADFRQLVEMSEEAQLANEIDSQQFAARLYFKKYETSGDTAFLDMYNGSFNHIVDSINRVQEINNEERVTYINDIKKINDKYKQDFNNFVKLNGKLDVFYKDLSGYGESLILSLNNIQEISYGSGDFEIYMASSEALENLLNARLRASKYFDFHTDTEFNSYLKYFEVMESNIKKLSSISRNPKYASDYGIASKNAENYKNGMNGLNQVITEMELIKDDMDIIGPQISDLAEDVKTSAISDIALMQSDVEGTNNFRSVIMLFLSTVAIVIGGFVAVGILRLVLKPIYFLTETFNTISQGDADIDFRLPDENNDEIGHMSKAFNMFMIKLKDMMEDIKYQNMIKTAESDIAEIVREEDDLKVISDHLIEYICKATDSIIGALYLPSEDRFDLESSYAYTFRKGTGNSINSGEGLVGQSIKENKMIVLNDIPEDYVLVQSGIGNSTPNTIMVIPCSVDNEIECVIELGIFANYDDKKIAMMESLSEVIGRVIHSVKVRHQMKELLDKTLTQSEELQMQQEELRQSNEELEEQARALKESESKLQQQQEELRVSNEELETYAKQLEEQKKTLNDKNDELMLTQSQIMEKATELEKANKYKSEFLANMSHELRTPLNSILVLSQLLSGRESNEPLTDKEREFATTIYSSGNDLLSLINGVLDLSKVEAGKLQVCYEKVYFEELKVENERLFVPMADTKSLDLNFRIDERIPKYIETDSMRLNQILKNLISNAIKFTHEGAVYVDFRPLTTKEVKTLNVSEDDYVAFEVSDTGIGIPSNKLDEVFEAFKQSDGTTSRLYGGTGLGLTISLELAKLLGGYILLESQVDKGSNFVLIIPVKQKVTIEETSISNVLKVVDELSNNNEVRSDMISEIGSTETDLKTENNSTNESEISSSEKRILIIEDDATFAQILSDLAEDRGYKVSKAYSGKEGLLMAKSMKPTGIILDIGLPDIDGMILAKMLSDDVETKDIPIHVISGKEGDITQSMPSSIIGFLKKPVDIKSIYKTLAKIESIDSGGYKKILVVGECGGEDFKQFSQLGKVSITKILSGKEAIEELKSNQYGCIVLDVKLEDMNGIDFMTNIRNELSVVSPVVIYTDEEIASDEIDDINKYAESIIIKSSKSKDRLVDEVTLFLHDVKKNTSDSKNVSNQQKNHKHDLEGVRVLLADDDSRNIFALMHVLENQGMDVTIAKDGIEAVDRFNSHEVDIVLMDIMMPKKDGYEAIREIRETSRGKNVPIIALTAKAMSDDRDKCISAGANDYLTKPVDVERLLSIIKVWLS